MRNVLAARAIVARSSPEEEGRRLWRDSAHTYFVSETALTVTLALSRWDGIHMSGIRPLAELFRFKEVRFVQQTMIRKTATSESGKGGAAETIMQRLESRIGKRKFEMWFAHTRVSVKGAQVEVSADSPFCADWIGSHFRGELVDVARQAIGLEPSIEIVSSGECTSASSNLSSGTSSSSAGSAAPSDVQAQGGERTTVRTKKPQAVRRLNDFVVGPSNRLAHSAACRLAEDADAQMLSPLFIHGPCGVGKTHLLLGVCHRFSERWPSARVRYVPAEQFTNEYITAVRTEKIDEFRRRVRRLDLLAIDDVHFLSNKMRTQSEFLHTLDAIAMGGARVVLASDGHPRQITSLNQALISRFLSGMVVQIDLPDRQLRTQLVRTIAASHGLVMTEEAAHAIATRCVGTARELEGAIAKLIAIRDVRSSNGHVSSGRHGTHEPIGLVMVERLFAPGAGLDGCGGSRSAKPVRINDVIEVVCERIGLEKADLTGSGRHQRIVLARALVAHLARVLTTLSFPEIARSMGRKHHSTIHTASSRLARQIADGERVPKSLGCEIAVGDFVDQLRHEIMKR